MDCQRVCLPSWQILIRLASASRSELLEAAILVTAAKEAPEFAAHEFKRKPNIF